MTKNMTKKRADHYPLSNGRLSQKERDLAPAVTVLWLDFHTSYSLMIASKPMYCSEFIFASAFDLTEYAPHWTR